MANVLLSASVKRFSLSRMQDFFNATIRYELLVILQRSDFAKEWKNENLLPTGLPHVMEGIIVEE